MEKIILVTGASSGIGYDCCRRFLEDGYTVIAVGRNEERLKSLQSHIKDNSKLHCVIKDLSCNIDKLDKWIKEAVSTYGRLDGLVLSAGLLDINPIKLVNYKKLRDIFSVNFDVNYMLIKGFADRRSNKGAGSFVTIISSIASVEGETGLSAYSATKGALNSLTKSMAQELSRQNIRVNSILPGQVETNMLNHYSEEDLKKMKKEYPLGIGQVYDVSAAVKFLCSDEAKWITGALLPVDGGKSL